MPSIPVMRPKLPATERLAPYLQSIDASRVYSNYGPLTLSLEDRLAAHYRLNQGTIGTVANATVGLAIALAIQHPPPGTLCVMPAWTFVASAHAAVMAGLVPYFVDVDAATWALDVGTISEQIARAPAQVGAVMPVAPFGAPIDLPAWESFRLRTGLAVAIDAAAAFDSLQPTAIPAVVSLHATKVLATGEGGFVVSTDTAIQREVRMRANFGFAGSRQAQAPAYNAKLSEYHAAVGHAALDEWVQTRAEWNDVAAAYRGVIGRSNRVRLQSGFGENWISSTCLLNFGEQITDRVERALSKNDIETRRWWGTGAHDHPATHAFSHSALSITDTLAHSTLGVPFYRGLSASEIARVVQVVLAAADMTTGQ
jgi:dTDP-4-amino-4,6-dideoxygalactose transaminase